MNNNSDWHLQTQNGDYLDLSVKRLSSPILVWVKQFTEIINEHIDFFNKSVVKINDIGCNVGHFYRNIDKIEHKIEYTGFDISKTYLDIARQHFANTNFVLEDVGAKNFDINKYNCDITIISATLEHIHNYEQLLENIFKSTKKLVIIRTFLGEESRFDECLKPEAKQSYMIRQFKIDDLKDKNFNKGWTCKQVTDLATDGLEKEVGEHIFRTQKVIIFTNDQNYFDQKS